MTPSKPDTATDSELRVIAAAVEHAQCGLEYARKAVCELRPSDEYVRALDALEQARAVLNDLGNTET